MDEELEDAERYSGIEAEYGGRIQRVEAEIGRVMVALSAALEFLQSAQQKAAESSYDDAIILSRDSMRAASSAILFKDGLMAADLESSCSYLKRRYGDSVQVSEWREVEALAQPSVMDSLAGIFGSRRGQREKDARRALECAARFVEATGTIIGEVFRAAAGAQPGEEGQEAAEMPEGEEEAEPEFPEEGIGAGGPAAAG